MIRRLHVRNYRSLGDTTVDFGPLTVLVGPNGAGKSNLVDALGFLADALSLGLEAAISSRQGIAEIRRWAPRESRSILIEVVTAAQDWEDADHCYSVEIESGADGAARVKREGFVPPNGDEWSRLGVHKPHDRLLLPLMAGASATAFCRHIRAMRLYRIFPDTLREPQRRGPAHPLDASGWNLASVLRGTARTAPSAFGEIVAALGKVSGVRGLKVVPVGGHLAIKLKRANSYGREHWFDASQESDGTLRMLGILTALYQSPPPSLIAIEEPELTVHPGVLALLKDVIEEASSQRTQVIITTHSPDLMALFDADVLRVVEMTDDGTRAGPVDSVQVDAIRDGLFSAGGIMRIEGLRPQEATG